MLSGDRSSSSSTSNALRCFHHLTQTKKTCSASSTGSWQSTHAAVSSFPILWRYSPKHPWLDNSCVMWKSTNPCFLPNHKLMSWIRLLVHPPLLTFVHSACHFLVVSERISDLKSLPVLVSACTSHTSPRLEGVPVSSLQSPTPLPLIPFCTPLRYV